MNDDALYQTLTSEPDGKAITQMLDGLGQQGFLFASQLSVIGVFECLMYRTLDNTEAFENPLTKHVMYNYEVGKVENREENVKNYLNAMGALDWKIATSWIEGNYIALVMYKVVPTEN